MTRDDIIELANKAADQAPREDWNTNVWVFGEEMLEYFAALVAAAEREACAQVCDEIANKPSNVVLGVALDCAAAIRARGKK